VSGKVTLKNIGWSPKQQIMKLMKIESPHSSTATDVLQRLGNFFLSSEQHRHRSKLFDHHIGAFVQGIFNRL